MNVKVLTKHEHAYLNNRYTIVLSDNHIHVKVNGFSRVTVHRLDENINITSKVRRMTLTTQAIDMWSKLFVDKWSLIDVQNAINYLKISYQEVNEKTVTDALNIIKKKNAEQYM